MKQLARNQPKLWAIKKVCFHKIKIPIHKTIQFNPITSIKGKNMHVNLETQYVKKVHAKLYVTLGKAFGKNQPLSLASFIHNFLLEDATIHTKNYVRHNFHIREERLHEIQL